MSLRNRSGCGPWASRRRVPATSSPSGIGLVCVAIVVAQTDRHDLGKGIWLIRGDEMAGAGDGHRHGVAHDPRRPSCRSVKDRQANVAKDQRDRTPDRANPAGRRVWEEHLPELAEHRTRMIDCDRAPLQEAASKEAVSSSAHVRGIVHRTRRFLRTAARAAPAGRPDAPRPRRRTPRGHPVATGRSRAGRSAHVAGRP